MVSAVRRAVRALEPGDVDRATVELALRYARRIDAAADDDVDDVLAQLGPKLLSTLEALELSPRARGQVVKGGARGHGPSPLDVLRARRASRVDDAETVDATPS